MNFTPAASRAGRGSLRLYFAIVVLVMYAPLAVLMLLAFNKSTIAAFPMTGFSLHWFRVAAQDHELLTALAASIKIAVAASLVALVLSSLAGLGLARNRFRGRAVVYLLLLSPLIMPFIVVGVILLVFFKVMGVPLSSFTVVIGHVLVILPYTLLVLVPRLVQINPELEEAARDLGATRLGAYWHVLRPLMTPALVSGFIIGLTTSFDEYPVASFLIGNGITFPVYLYSRLRLPTGQAEIVAVGAVITLITLLLVIVAVAFQWASGLRSDGRPRRGGLRRGGSRLRTAGAAQGGPRAAGVPVSQLTTAAQGSQGDERA